MQRFRLFEWEYSLVPPWTEGWEVHGRTKDWDLHVQDKRDFPNELNTFSSSRRQIPIINSSQELVAMTKEVMEKGHQDTNRYTILRHEVGVYKTNKAMCARSQLALTDKKALISKSGKRGPMMRDVETLACVHPSNKNMVVMMVYSHRYQSGNRDAEFVEKASRTFNSLAFTKKN